MMIEWFINKVMVQKDACSTVTVLLISKIKSIVIFVIIMTFCR